MALKFSLIDLVSILIIHKFNANRFISIISAKKTKFQKILSQKGFKFVSQSSWSSLYVSIINFTVFSPHKIKWLNLCFRKLGLFVAPWYTAEDNLYRIKISTFVQRQKFDSTFNFPLTASMLAPRSLDAVCSCWKRPINNSSSQSYKSMSAWSDSGTVCARSAVARQPTYVEIIYRILRDGKLAWKIDSIT